MPGLIDRFNTVLKAGQPSLRSTYKVQPQHRTLGGTEIPCETGEAVDDSAYEQHVKEYMPTAADKKLLIDIITNEKKWIAPKEGGRDPLAP